MAKVTSKQKRKKKVEKRIPYHRKPENMTNEEWQKGLRKQFAKENEFEIANLGNHPVYSDFHVNNPATGNTYKVAIRSNFLQIEQGVNRNFCECYDFKTNQLGTCKHIEAVYHKLYPNTKLRKYFKETYEQEHSSVYLDYRGGRTLRLSIGTLEREKIPAFAADFFDEQFALKPEKVNEVETFFRQVRLLTHTFRLYDDALSFLIEKRSSASRVALLKEKIGNEQSSYFDSLIDAKLHSYQKEGVWFAANAGRSMIADEMGLGKTIQAIALAELYRKELGIEKVLIVCPTSLKYQWKSEIEKFTSHEALVIEGSQLKRKPQYLEDTSFYKIVSYNVVGRDLEAINEMEADLVILDEAQRIKNWKTKTAANIKKITSPFALVLTGTPLENKLEELYSIIQFIDPFLFGSLFNFLNRYQVKDEESGKLIGYQNLNEVGELIKGVMIRRKKKQVLKQLPKRTDKNLFVPMTSQQNEIHEEYKEMVARLVHKWQRLGFLPEKDRQRLMIAMNMMRMACNSTFVIDQKTRHDTKIEETINILEEALSIENAKVVIFSQWERMTRIVAQELTAREIGFEYLHGGIPSAKRADLLTNFREKPASKVFLSTDAGGVGLNLQSASFLINLDIPWNPAVLEQRIGRVYRIGQDSNVNIINLVSTGTIEHRMLDVLDFKSGIAAGALDNEEDVVFMKQDSFKKFMESVEDVVDGEAASTGIAFEDEVEDALEKDAKPKSTPETFVNDDDVVAPSTEMKDKKVASKPPKDTQVATSEPQQLMANGLQFFNQLSKTLQDPKATQQLVSSITEKDEATGKTYLKVPVEDEKAVENILNMFGNFAKLFQQ